MNLRTFGVYSIQFGKTLAPIPYIDLCVYHKQLKCLLSIAFEKRTIKWNPIYQKNGFSIEKYAKFKLFFNTPETALPIFALGYC